jgi:hypothetical protein
VATTRILFVAPAIVMLLIMLYEARTEESALLLEVSFLAPIASHIPLLMCKSMHHFWLGFRGLGFRV